MPTITLDLHAYSNGVPFVTVRCTVCNTVLNSGHHYRTDDAAHAIHLGQDHVDERHGGRY